MAGIRRRSALSEATTFVHGTLPAAYLQLDDVSGVYQEESVRIRPFDLGQSARAVSEWRVYPANRDARALLTDIQSMHYGRVHRLDPINVNIPAKLLDSWALTLGLRVKQIWPVYLCNPPKDARRTATARAVARIGSLRWQTREFEVTLSSILAATHVLRMRRGLPPTRSRVDSACSSRPRIDLSGPWHSLSTAIPQ